MIDDRELTLAKRIAWKTAARWSLVDAEEVSSELILWLYQNEAAVDRYRAEEGGEGKLFTALRRTATRFAVKEQEARSGGPLELSSLYTVAQLERALPFIFEDIPQTSVLEVNGRAVSQVPTEYGRAAAVLLDTREAYEALPQEARTVLALRFRDGMNYADISTLVGITESGVKKRVRRALVQMRAYLDAGA